MRCARTVAVAVGLMALAPALQVVGQTTQADDLPGVVRRLGSDEFAVRSAAQRELEKVPAARVEELRAAMRVAADEEVKVRLGMRVDAIELDALMHPKPLTVKVEKGKTGDVAKQINDQLGFRYLLTGQDTTNNTSVITIDAKDQPLWEILRQMNAQGEFMISDQTIFAAPAGQQMTVRFGMPAGGAVARPVTVIEGMGVVADTSGTPAKGNWTLQCRVYLDPRVRVAGFTPALRVAKAVDQEGRELQVMPSPGGMTKATSRAMPMFRMSATFATAAGVTSIMRLQGSETMQILVSEKTIAMDVNDLPKEPVDTPLGKLVVEKTGEIDYAVTMAGADENTPAGLPGVQVLLKSKDGRVLAYDTLGIHGGVSLHGRTTPPAPATLEVVVPEKVREVTVPITLENVTVMPERPPMRSGGRR